MLTILSTPLFPLLFKCARQKYIGREKLPSYLSVGWLAIMKLIIMVVMRSTGRQLDFRISWFIQLAISVSVAGGHIILVQASMETMGVAICQYTSYQSHCGEPKSHDLYIILKIWIGGLRQPKGENSA